MVQQQSKTDQEQVSEKVRQEETTTTTTTPSETTPYVEREDKALENSYVVWAIVKQQKQFQQQSSVDMSETYQVANKPVAKFATVNEFWNVYSHFRRPSVMPLGTFLHFFIENVQPLWEDENCQKGGRWSIRTPKTHTGKFWEDLVLAMIGEQFDAPQKEVLGLVLSLKFNADTISVWHRTSADKEIVNRLKASIEGVLDLQEGMQLEYECFADVLSGKGPTREKASQRAKESKGDSNQNKEGQFIKGGGAFERGQNLKGGRGGQRGGFRGRGRGGAAFATNTERQEGQDEQQEKTSKPTAGDDWQRQK